MPHVGSEIDANFYQLIHKMLVVPRPGEGRDRRLEKRHSYRTTQRVAPWDGSRMPDESQFIPIQCHDLTGGGFSFLTAADPDFKSLVVQFGSPPNALYVAAQVLRSTPVRRLPSGAVTRLTDRNQTADDTARPDECGEPLFLVGCRFLRRLRRPTP